MPEEVVHPDHYNQYSGFEVIDVCEQLRGPDGKGNFNRGNAFKYLARAGWKDPNKEIQDLEKAKFYIEREIQRIATADWTTEDPDIQVRPAKGSCPDCGIVLTPMFGSDTDFICPNNHGWMEVKDGERTWHPPYPTLSGGDFAKAEPEVPKLRLMSGGVPEVRTVNDVGQ